MITNEDIIAKIYKNRNVKRNYITEKDDVIRYLKTENETLKSIIKEIDDYCVKTNSIDREEKNLDYNYICGWNAGKDEVCTRISFILDKENI